jgi:hypothetical protein
MSQDVMDDFVKSIVAPIPTEMPEWARSKTETPRLLVVHQQVTPNGDEAVYFRIKTPPKSPFTLEQIDKDRIYLVLQGVLNDWLPSYQNLPEKVLQGIERDFKSKL